MAVKKVIEIDVNTLNAQGGLDKFVETLKETEQQSVSLKTELRQLKQQLAELPEGTAEYDKIAKRAGEVSDQIGDINTKVKNLGSDTKGIDAVVQGAQTLSGAFSVASSASALLGDENEDLQKVMLKVESAIGLTVGIQSIANALQKESALYLGISSTATKVQTALQLAYTTVVGGTTGALKALKIAMATTGIGALVVLVGYLVSKMGENTDATEDQTKAQEALNDSISRTNDLYKEDINNLKDVTKERVLRAKISGASEKELQQIEKDGQKERDERYKQERDRLFSQLNDKKLSLKQTQDINKQLSDNQKEYLKSIDEARFKDLESELDFTNKKRDQAKKDAEEAKRISEEKAKKLLEIEKKKHEDLLKEANDFFANAKALEDMNDSEREQALKDQAERLKAFRDPETIALAETEKGLAEINAFKGTLGEKELLLNDFNSKVLANEALTAEQKDYYAKRSLEQEKIINSQKLSLLGQSFGKVSELLGKNSKAGKAFAVSQALMNVYQGITAELATKTTTPFEFGVKLVNIASVVGIGFKAVKDILKTPEMSTGGGGASGGGGGGGASAPSSAPQFNVVGNAGVNQIASTLGKDQPPMQAYVVAGAVTTQQSLNRNIVANASI